MVNINRHSRTIQIPINHREFPPSYEESQRMKRLEDEFDGIWEQGESPPETQSNPIAPSAPSASIFSTGDEIFTIYSTGCFERIDDSKHPVNDENPASNLSIGNENFTVYSTGCFENNDENPVDVEVNIEETEFAVNGTPQPTTNIPQENENNLFCTPDDYTMKGWCICLFSRCFMLFAHLCLFISLLPQKLKSCFHSKR